MRRGVQASIRLNYMETPVIVYEDNHVLVVIKPANMPSQGDPSGDLDLLTYLKEMLVKRDNKPGSAYLGLVHRLDRPVSGLVVFAKTSKAAARLSEQVKSREMSRRYLAVVCGVAQESGTLRDYLLKDERSNTTRIVDAGHKNAKEAILNYRRIGVFEGSDLFSLVEVELITGRSHQIRIQMTSVGHPIFGDFKYGHGKPGQQIALFARKLRFIHPTQKRVLEFSALPRGTPWSLFDVASLLITDSVKDNGKDTSI